MYSRESRCLISLCVSFHHGESILALTLRICQIAKKSALFFSNSKSISSCQSLSLPLSLSMSHSFFLSLLSRRASLNMRFLVYYLFILPFPNVVQTSLVFYPLLTRWYQQYVLHHAWCTYYALQSIFSGFELFQFVTRTFFSPKIYSWFLANFWSRKSHRKSNYQCQSRNHLEV